LLACLSNGSKSPIDADLAFTLAEHTGIIRPDVRTIISLPVWDGAQSGRISEYRRHAATARRKRQKKPIVSTISSPASAKADGAPWIIDPASEHWIPSYRLTITKGSRRSKMIRKILPAETFFLSTTTLPSHATRTLH
jgi:hypothetical protein